MSNYERLAAGEQNDADLSVKSAKYESFQLEKEKDLIPHVRKFRNWCYLLILLALPMPVAGWFTEEYHILFYQSIAYSLALIIISILGLRTLKQNLYRRLSSYKKFIHIYFISLLGLLIANEIILTSVIIENNSNNCSDFSYNKVCKDRWGIMGQQLILIIFFPLIDFTVFIIYRYFLQVVSELMTSLLKRDL